MVGTVKTRRTHYEVLGLEPTATGEEIERAFAGSISIFQPHGIGGVAEAAVAFRTLRDPARRRAYDASLGLNAKPETRPPLMTWRVGAQFMTASGIPVLPQPRSEALAELPAEPEPAPPIAAALRKLASPEPLHAAPPAPEFQVEANPTADRPVAGNRAVHLALNEGRGEAEAGSVPWKPIGIAAGAVIVAGAIIGGWAGWDASSAAEPESATNAARAALPPPTNFTISDPATTAPSRVLDDARPLPPKRTARVAARVARARPTSQLADVERQLSELPAPVPAHADATGQAVEAAPAAGVVAANLPLPNRVIARTIERIGYPCGQIASSVPVGAGGAFTVTCTSGHSYQAAPVRGRYHFRRLRG
jgi:hypothetical protein